MGSGLQRVGGLCAVPDLLREMGVDPAPVLARAGIEPSALRNPDNLISYVSVGALLDEGSKATRCDHFGLRVGGSASLETLGVVGRLIQNSPTLGEAVTAFLENQHRYVRGAVPYLLVEGETAFIGYAVYQPNVRALTQIYDCAIATAINSFLELTGRRPDEAFLPRAEPRDSTAWHSQYKIPVRFDSEQAGIVFPRTLLSVPIPGANPVLRRILSESVDAYWLVAQPSVVDRVMRLLRPRITAGDTTLKDIAERMGLHPRTLNRRLQEEETSFRELLNNARMNVACQMLECTNLSITQIGLMINYADSAVFSHSFRRLSGQTPSEWRANAWRQRSAEAAAAPVSVTAGA